MRWQNNFGTAMSPDPFPAYQFGKRLCYDRLGVMGITVGWFTASLVRIGVKLHPPIGMKKGKDGIRNRKTHGATGLKLSMHTQIDSGSDMIF